MKKLLYILFAFTLFTSCSSDDDPVTGGQDYTSFVFFYSANVDKFPNCIAAYKKDGKYYKVADLGDILKDKYSKEIKVTNSLITDIYLFTDYNSVIRFDEIYSLKKNKKNVFKIEESTGGIHVLDKTDPTQYPQ